MATRSKRADVDAMVAYLFLKKLMTPINRTEAYRKGLVNGVGKTIKEPKTEDEKQAFTLLDKMIFRIKRLLGTRVANLFNFLYLQTLNNQIYNNIIIMGSVQQRAEIKRMAKDLTRLQESYQVDPETMTLMLLEEYWTQEREDEIING